MTQEWFADALYKDAEIEEGALGMAELMAGEASFAEVMHRDLSSNLDVIPAGSGLVSGEGIDEILEALAASYAFVVIHASDWRSDPALEALDTVDNAILAAPASRLRDSVSHMREAMGGEENDVLGFVVADDRSRVERAA